MNQKEFYQLLQKHVAEVSITNSSLRKQGGKGLIQAAREFCTNLQIYTYNVNSQEAFNRILNNDTKELMSRFPTEARNNWGAARKALNLFLREVLYNTYLSKQFNSNVIKFLEIPLDEQVTTEIRENAWGKSLPRWNTIKSLKKEMSDEYQKIANQIAQDEEIARIHLDLKYWRNKEKK